MKNNFLPWFLLFCAVGLSATAAYYSVIGLSIVFVGAAIPVIIMGSFLEVSKIAIATYLHNSWKKTYRWLKVYLTVALVTLSIITSIGIYGLLSTGFQENIAKMEIGGKQIQNIEIKKQRYEEIKIDLSKSQTTLDKDISQLRNALSTNTTTQYVDKKTGQIIIRANNPNRKTFESQLSLAQNKRDTLSSKIDILNDSITSLDIKILDMESKASEGNELGAVQYVSEITGASLQVVANWFIFLLIFVFDPLAITLVIATNQAFEQKKPKLNIYGEPKISPSPPEPKPTTPETPIFTHPDYAEQEKLRIQQEIEKVQKSNASMRKSGLAIQDLQNKIRDLDNIKTNWYGPLIS
jgi:hypothetical protein